MKNRISLLLLLAFSSLLGYSQTEFSEETQMYIAYQDSVIVFKNALLIDGKGNPAKAKQTVIIKKGIINWIGNDADAKPPKETKTINMNGRTLMPGLVMLHEHMYISGHSFSQRMGHVKQAPATFPRLYLAAGATTIRTGGSIEPYSDLNMKMDIDEGKIPGPSMEVTAPYLERKGSFFRQMPRIETPKDARAFVNYWADQGFTSFKGYMFIDKASLQAAIEAVHERNLKITAHLCAVTYEEAAEMGIDQLEHGFFASSDFVAGKEENKCPPNLEQFLANLNVNSAEVKRLLQLLVDRKVTVTSTLAVIEGYTSTQPEPSEELLSYFSTDNREYYLNRLAMIKSAPGPTRDDSLFANNAKMEKMFYDMGGLLTVGTDPTGNGGTIPGFGNWRAIELLVEADGFTPLEAIKIATMNGAIALGFQNNIGTIEVGKSADLLIIDGDPSKNISDLRKVQYVFKSGVGYDSKKLYESVRGQVGFN